MKPRICLTILAFAFIVPATEANAQLMPDSTVQITAYWQKGDQMTYDYRSTECLVEDGDTVRLRSYSDIRTIEVIDATPTRYTLRPLIPRGRWPRSGIRLRRCRSRYICRRRSHRCRRPK